MAVASAATQVSVVQSATQAECAARTAFYKAAEDAGAYREANDGSRATHLDFTGFRGGKLSVPAANEAKFREEFAKVVAAGECALYLNELRTYPAFNMHWDIDILTSVAPADEFQGLFARIVQVILDVMATFYAKDAKDAKDAAAQPPGNATAVVADGTNTTDTTDAKSDIDAADTADTKVTAASKPVVAPEAAAAFSTECLLCRALPLVEVKERCNQSGPGTSSTLLYKAGAHLIHPNLGVSVKQALVMRDAVIAALYDANVGQLEDKTLLQIASPHAPQATPTLQAQSYNINWNDAIDEAVYLGNGLRMLGSHKCDLCECRSRAPSQPITFASSRGTLAPARTSSVLLTTARPVVSSKVAADPHCGVCQGRGWVDKGRQYVVVKHINPPPYIAGPPPGADNEPRTPQQVEDAEHVEKIDSLIRSSKPNNRVTADTKKMAWTFGVQWASTRRDAVMRWVQTPGWHLPPGMTVSTHVRDLMHRHQYQWNEDGYLPDDLLAQQKAAATKTVAAPVVDPSRAILLGNGQSAPRPKRRNTTPVPYERNRWLELEGFIRSSFHPRAYQELRVENVELADSQQFFVINVTGRGERYCQNKQAEHTHQRVWFYMSREYMAQRCYSRKQVRRPGSDKPCPRFESSRMILTTVLKTMFWSGNNLTLAPVSVLANKLQGASARAATPHAARIAFLTPTTTTIHMDGGSSSSSSSAATPTNQVVSASSHSNMFLSPHLNSSAVVTHQQRVQPVRPVSRVPAERPLWEDDDPGEFTSSGPEAEHKWRIQRSNMEFTQRQTKFDEWRTTQRVLQALRQQVKDPGCKRVLPWCAELIEESYAQGRKGGGSGGGGFRRSPHTRGRCGRGGRGGRSSFA